MIKIIINIGKAITSGNPPPYVSVQPIERLVFVMQTLLLWASGAKVLVEDKGNAASYYHCTNI
jgi:hypothetical protein